jgi:hypothetical protein
MTIETKLKIIYELRPFQKAPKCPIQITETLVMCEKVHFSTRGLWSRPYSRTPRPRIPNPRPYQLSRSKSDCKMGDRRIEDATILVENFFFLMCSNKNIQEKLEKLKNIPIEN